MNTIKVKTASVGDVLQVLGHELKMQELTDQLGVSKTTVKDRIKKMGYKWDAKQAKYIPDESRGFTPGRESELFIDYFEKKPLEIARTVKQNAPKSSHKSSEPTNTGLDMIDVLLNLKPVERVQRGYYLDKDLADIIDKVTGNQRSNLVNECIRKVFEEKGLL